MPKKKKTTNDEGLMGHFITQFLDRAQELLEKHADGIQTVLEDSEDQKVGVTFNLLIDASESQPKETIRIRYSEVHTDERVVQLDDPKQGTFSAISEEAKGPGRPRKSKSAEPEEPED